MYIRGIPEMLEIKGAKEQKKWNFIIQNKFNFYSQTKCFNPTNPF